MKILETNVKKLRSPFGCECCNRKSLSMYITLTELFRGFTINIWLCKRCYSELKKYTKLEKEIREA